MGESNSCPHCGGRLVSGAKNCLHCGALVEPGRSAAAAEASGAANNFMVIGVLIIVVLGGISVVLIGTSADKAAEVMSKPVNFDGKTSSKICIPADSEDGVADLEAQGWSEVHAPAGTRCFQN